MRYKYDPSRVRSAFRKKYCRELDLPSGKPSGVELNPITEEEINKLMGDCEFNPPRSSEWVSISEWMLWSALRLKYGVNYLNPQPKCLQVAYERIYEESAKEDLKLHLEELELRMQNYVDNEMQHFNEKILEQINNGEKSTVKTMACMEEDFKKYFKKNLDIPEF